MPSADMTARVQDGHPFRETEWDHRLDKMLDDLKTTVSPDGERPSSRKDTSLVSSFRSSSRSESRGSNRGVEDLGLMKHHHKEYTSPDKSTRVITDEFEYDSGDPNKNFQKKVKKSTYSSYKVSGGISDELESLRQGPHPSVMADAAPKGPQVVSASQKVANKLVDALSTIGPTKRPKYRLDDDDLDVTEDKTGGEVKRIVWRNRFEKTYENKDSTAPTVSIEEDSKIRDMKHFLSSTDTKKTVSTFHPQPPTASPGGQHWPDPVPLPTPPQVSPGEPGVAYIYTYGQDGASQVQHLPPLNYVAAPPHGEGSAPSPTPSGSSQQPVIYHYSYHYNIMPGQTLPDGMHIPPGSKNQPALQVATPPRSHPPAQIVTQNSSHLKSSSHSQKHSSVAHSDKEVHHHFHHHPHSDKEPAPFPTKDPKGPDSNISITINKTTTHTTRTKEFPTSGVPPSTSTPYHSRGRSRSPSPDRYTRGYKYTTYSTSYGNDSLERLKKPGSDGLPFPDTSPIKPSADGSIPRKVDELMHSFDSEDGRRHYYPHYTTANGPTQLEREPLVSKKVEEDDTELALVESHSRESTKERERSKNITGAPVYYPPGHQQLFTDSMHTMTLKENKRRGMAKWRAERKEGSKEKSSSSGGKGGMAMVPVCLPLCCGAACTIM